MGLSIEYPLSLTNLKREFSHLDVERASRTVILKQARLGPGLFFNLSKVWAYFASDTFVSILHFECSKSE